MNELEKIKNELNLEIRLLLSVIDMINGESKQYPDYETGTLNEVDYLKQQLQLIIESKEKLVNIFKK